MSTYIVINGYGVQYVVRTTDWHVIAECGAGQDATLIADALNAA